MAATIDFILRIVSGKMYESSPSRFSASIYNPLPWRIAEFFFFFAIDSLNVSPPISSATRASYEKKWDRPRW